jgi:hypothetical protein
MINGHEFNDQGAETGDEDDDVCLMTSFAWLNPLFVSPLPEVQWPGRRDLKRRLKHY